MDTFFMAYRTSLQNAKFILILLKSYSYSHHRVKFTVCCGFITFDIVKVPFYSCILFTSYWSDVLLP